MSPQWSDLVLAAHVPDGEADVLVLHGLHVEADGGDGGHNLPQLQLVQDGCLTSSIQTCKQKSSINFTSFFVGYDLTISLQS